MRGSLTRLRGTGTNWVEEGCLDGLEGFFDAQASD